MFYVFFFELNTRYTEETQGVLNELKDAFKRLEASHVGASQQLVNDWVEGVLWYEGGEGGEGGEGQNIYKHLQGELHTTREREPNGQLSSSALEKRHPTVKLLLYDNLILILILNSHDE